VENIEAILRAHAQGKGVLLLAGHFGNSEVATVAGMASFPQYRGRLHFVRRPLHPRWLDALVTRRFRRAGFGVLPKKGVLDAILGRLAAGDVIVYAFDQHAGGRDGVELEFFGHRAGTFRSLAIIALATGAPVVPAASWREPDGCHVLRFEEALPLISNATMRTRLSGGTGGPTTPSSSAWSCGTRSSGSGCTGGGESRPWPEKEGCSSVLATSRRAWPFPIESSPASAEIARGIVRWGKPLPPNRKTGQCTPFFLIVRF